MPFICQSPTRVTLLCNNYIVVPVIKHKGYMDNISV